VINANKFAGLGERINYEAVRQVSLQAVLPYGTLCREMVY